MIKSCQLWLELQLNFQIMQSNNNLTLRIKYKLGNQNI